MAQNSAARIVVFNQMRHVGETDVKREWRYCWRETGGFRTLVIDGSYGSGYGDIVGVGPVVLSGPWAAWGTTTVASGGRYGNGPIGAVSLRYLGGTFTKAAEVSGYETCRFDQLVLSRSGVAAWEVERCGQRANGRVFSWALQAMNGRNGKSATLDSTPEGPSSSDPFTNLQLYTCDAACVPIGRTVAWWQSDGVWQSGVSP